MADLRVMTITGRVGQAPEMQQAKSGTNYVRLSVGNSRNYKNDSGGWDSETVWCTALLYGRNAEYAIENFQKGCPVSVFGMVEFSIWKDEVQVTFVDAKVNRLLGKKAEAAVLGSRESRESGDGGTPVRF